jgi:nicotinamidase-related amidase
MLHTADQSLLLIVDIQTRLLPKIVDGQSVVKEATRLAQIAQILNIPIIGTEQTPQSLGENLESLKILCDQTFIKHHFNGCADGLIDSIPKTRNQIIVTGCEAHVCVLQTCFGLLEAGLKVTLVADAIGSRTENNRQSAINRLSQAGATIATVEMIAFEWLRTSKHQNFREILELIR